VRKSVAEDTAMKEANLTRKLINKENDAAYEMAKKVSKFQIILCMQSIISLHFLSV
jgi:hypothetical protein